MNKKKPELPHVIQTLRARTRSAWHKSNLENSTACRQEYHGKPLITLNTFPDHFIDVKRLFFFSPG